MRFIDRHDRRFRADCLPTPMEPTVSPFPPIWKYSVPTLAAFCLLVLLSLAPAMAQDDTEQDKPEIGPKYSNPVEVRWRVGARIRGGSRPATNVLVTLPIPNQWPEQRVSLIEEQIPDNFGQIGYRELESDVRQMVVKIPVVQANQEVLVAVVLKVETAVVDKPDDTTVFEKPKSSNREARFHLGMSPQVNYRNSKLRRFVKDLIEEQETAWEQVHTIYDWVRDNVEQTDGELKPALQTWEDRSGSYEGRAFLFVAMCRSAKIPARIVFAREMVYAEFMLADQDQEQFFWFPANVNGVYEFGEFIEPRVILQKGDNIEVPEKEQRQKFVAEFLKCQGRSKPKVTFIRGVVESEEIE